MGVRGKIDTDFFNLFSHLFVAEEYAHDKIVRIKTMRRTLKRMFPSRPTVDEDWRSAEEMVKWLCENEASWATPEYVDD